MEKLPTATREQIEAKLVRYATLGTGDVKAMGGDRRGLLRLRVGDYRVMFVEEPARINVHRIGHRREVYR